MVDRYYGWPSVHRAKSAESKEFIGQLRDHCKTFGVPEELTLDGGSAYISGQTQQFLSTWGINHRLSSAHNPHGNLRAEQGVRAMKRLIQGNLGPDGSLDNNRFSRVILGIQDILQPR